MLTIGIPGIEIFYLVSLLYHLDLLDQLQLHALWVFLDTCIDKVKQYYFTSVKLEKLMHFSLIFSRITLVFREMIFSNNIFHTCLFRSVICNSLQRTFSILESEDLKVWFQTCYKDMQELGLHKDMISLYLLPMISRYVWELWPVPTSFEAKHI